MGIVAGRVETCLRFHIAETTSRLLALATQSYETCQVIHGVFAGNLLWVDQSPPAVIGFSPYRRLAGYAVALTMVDAILRYGAEPTLIMRARDSAELDQWLIRACCLV